MISETSGCINCSAEKCCNSVCTIASRPSAFVSTSWGAFALGCCCCWLRDCGAVVEGFVVGGGGGSAGARAKRAAAMLAVVDIGREEDDGPGAAVAAVDVGGRNEGLATSVGGGPIGCCALFIGKECGWVLVLGMDWSRGIAWAIEERSAPAGVAVGACWW